MTTSQIPLIDAKKMIARDPDTMEALRLGARDVGFFMLTNTKMSGHFVEGTLATYRAFFQSSDADKQAVNMAATDGNRGWGAAGTEQVDPDANPDYKQYFDSGFELPHGDPWLDRDLAVYAPNLWPAAPVGFRPNVELYAQAAMDVAKEVLQAIAHVIGQPEDYFDDKFSRPMALLRGNYYPERPDWAGENDFGIATHTDYGCVTLLATDGAPGLEVRKRGGGWIPIQAAPGTFVINFGEMLQMWTGGDIIATPHRVVGGNFERISIPLFFNPNYDANVAPIGSGETILAGDHLEKRFRETYVHLKG